MLLQNCRFVVTQHDDRTIREDVDIRIDGGVIQEIGTGLSNDGRSIDCSDMLVMPGLVNAHTHVPMNVMRGISDDKPLQTWLEDDIFPAEDQLDGDAVYYGTLHGITEMLLTGTTTFNDMYAFYDRIVDAVDETGIRAVLGRGVTDADDSEKQGDRLQRSRELLELAAEHDRITGAAAPHAIYTCSAELLQATHDQAVEHDAPYHIHLSETRTENQDCQDEHGMTPTAYLADIGVLDERTVAAHGVHLSADDRQHLVAAGAGVAHNPCANLKLGSGIADIHSLQEAGIPVGLGTDSVASNNNLNMFEELKIAALLQKERDPRALDAQTALDMATRGSAAVLGLDDVVGRIAPGYRADLACIDLHDIAMTPYYGKHGLLSNLVFAYNGPVTHTFVDGEQVVQNRTVTTVDTATIQEEVQDIATMLADTAHSRQHG